jgi:hypothetical protein
VSEPIYLKHKSNATVIVVYSPGQARRLAEGHFERCDPQEGAVTLAEYLAVADMPTANIRSDAPEPDAPAAASFPALPADEPRITGGEYTPTPGKPKKKTVEAMK